MCYCSVRKIYYLDYISYEDGDYPIQAKQLDRRQRQKDIDPCNSTHYMA
jgi:hypothetical protein